MKISGQKHRNGAKFYSLVMLAFLWTLAGTAFADEPLHVFDAGATSFFMESNAIAGVGDINQDGHEDYLVGVPENTDIQFYKGAVYLVSGADGGQLAMFEGESSYEMFGYGVACAGDVNQDGVNDFLIASMYALGDRAAVFVYSGADGSRLHTLPSPYPNTDFGNIMASVGDKDGDGIPDFAIAAPGCYADHRGAVFLYSTALGGMIIYEWSGDSSYAAFGRDLAAADIDGDGMLDLVISAPGKDEGSSDNVGALYWVPGGFGPMATFAQGDIAGEQLGFRIAAVDDISGDGIKDIAALDRTGQIHLFSGVYPAGAPLASFASGMTESEIPDWVQMVSIGDFNGDGAGDLLVGRPEAEGGMGVVQVLSGLDGWVLKTYPGAPYGLFGSRLAADVDLDGNGFQDFLIGAGGTYAGAVFAYAGLDPQPADSDGDGMPDSWETDNGLDPQNPGDAELDLDADGLTNLEEYQNNTDPYNPDSDWDAMLDGWEVAHGLNPLVMADAWEDPDGDGLLNIDESVIGTDPHNGDTDGDTLPDAWEAQSGLNPTDAADADVDLDGDGLTCLAEYAAGTHPTRADTDGDGLSDGDEIARGLDPLQADSDGDSAPDGWEDQYGLDPLDGSDGAGDLDGDGLTNQAEYAAGTNPTLADSDGDTLSDGDEVHTYQTDPGKSDTDNDGLDDGDEVTVHLTQPLNADSDGDTLSDGAEVNTHHTDPLNTDSDSDGMPDGWEVDQAFDPNNAGDAAQDADNDAATNLAEFLAGTDPHNPATYPGGPGTLKWSFAAPPIVSSASLDPDGSIYVTSSDSNLYALNADGTQKWSAPLTAALGKAALIAEDGTIYVNEKNDSTPQTLYSIAPDGTLNWSVEPGYGTIAHTPAQADDGTLYVPVRDKLMAYNPDGTAKWIAATDGYDTSSPAVAQDGTIYVKSYGDKLYAFNPDGSRKWVFTLSARNKLTFSGPVIADDGTVYVCDNGGAFYNGSVHAVNPDGTEKWKYVIGQSRAAIAIGPDGTLYVSGNRFYALSAGGALNWVVDLPGGIESSPAIAADGTLYVIGSSAPYPVHAVNPDGSIAWSYETGEQEYLTDPVLGADGTLYVGSRGGNLYALRTNGMEPAASAWPMTGHDARHTGNAETMLNQAPEISIASPADGSIFNVDDGAIALTAMASDPEEGDLSASVQWNSSLDGAVVPPAALSVGVHTLMASVTDSQGLTATASITVTVEAHVNVAPTISITAPANGAVVNEDDGPIAFAATAADPEDGDISAGIQWSSSIDGAFIPPKALSVGVHSVTASVSDSQGSTATASITVTVEAHVNVAPSVSITAPANGAVVNEDDGAIAFAATAADPEDGDISAGIQWSSSLDGAFTPPAALSVGLHSVTASISDSQGSTATASITVTVEAHVNVAPTLSITAPANGAVVNVEDGPIAFDFTATDAEDGDLTSSVIWESSIDGIVQSPATLSVGTHTLTARVTDSGGLTTSENIACTVASTADQYAIKGGVGAYYVDNNNDGQFTQAFIGGDLDVAARRISFANSYYTKRANLEIELSALRASGQHVSRAAIQLYATAYGAYPFQIDIYGYAADGVAELADADGGGQIIGSFQADGTGNYEAEITDYINQLIDSGAQWVGLSLRSANESGTNGIDEHLDFKGFDYSSPVFAGAALLVSYAEPPVVSIASPADNAVVSEDDGPIAFAATAADPEDGDISAAVQWNSSLDGAFTPPAALSVGTHTVTASVTDSSGLTADASITVTVEAHVNVPPTLSITAPADGAVFNVDDGPTAFSAAAADLEDGDISADVQWSSSLDGAFTPPAALSVGTHTVTASVTDSSGLTADASITVTVAPHVNAAATITMTTPGDGAVFNEDDGPIAFAATAADPEDGDISAGIQWSSSLDGAFTPPAALSVGTHTVTASVTDSGGLTSVSTITVIVGAHVNLAPEVTITAPLDGDTVYCNNRPVDFAAVAVDAEQGDMGSFVQWSSSLDGAFTPPAILSAGTHVITASVTDTQGLTGSAAITLHVEESDNVVLDYEQFIETGTVADVGTQNWTTVHLAGAYTSMVVVCTPVYDNTAPPMVTRIQNAAGSSFQLKLDRADGQTEEVAGIDVYYVVVQEGVYTQAEHGITMEAVRMVSTATDGKGSWNGQSQAYAGSYVQPVVVGQVMTANDPAFSVFWSRGASKSSPPSASTLKVGKHAGEDPVTYRTDETLGYLVIESSSGVIGDLKFSAGVGADIVTGMPKGTNPGISYGFTGFGQPTCAVLSQTAMDGGDGGWAILYGTDPISVDTVSLVIDEDKISDAERNHTTEQVAYLVFGQ